MKFLVTGGTGFIGAAVVKALTERNIATVVTDLHLNPTVTAKFSAAAFEALDVSDARGVDAVFERHPDITHCIHLAYLMSAEVEANPTLGVNVNVLGMVNMFEAAVRRRLTRLVFTSSETVYGASQQRYGDRPVTEDDFCAPDDHFFTYGVMKLLDEFMARKYVEKHGVSIACVRPAVVFGHGRKRGAVLWAGDFASRPAHRREAQLPFSRHSRETWVYKDDCAEQLVRLALEAEARPFRLQQRRRLRLSRGDRRRGQALAARGAEIAFDETKPRTPLIDWQDGERLAQEIDFRAAPACLRACARISTRRSAKPGRKEV